MLGTHRIATVSIRRNINQAVRENAEQLEGKSYKFTYGWLMDSEDPYPDEIAWIPRDDKYPLDAPVWIASGDLL